jgi:hypothetical protein
LVNKHVFDRGFGSANEVVFSSGVRHFLFLGDSEASLLLGSLLELLLNEDLTALDDVCVLTDHVEAEFKLTTGRSEVLVCDD